MINDILLVQIEIPLDGETPPNQQPNVILFECHFMGKYIKYYPEMFINICYNFLVADLQLKKDIQLLLQIAEQVKNMN